MKKLVFLLFMITLNSNSFAQSRKIIAFGSNVNFALANPETNTLFGKNKEGDVPVTHFNLYTAFAIVHKPKFSWSLGISAKKQAYYVLDRIKTLKMENYTYYDYYDVYNPPTDYSAISWAYGLYNEFDFTIKKGRFLSQSIGFGNEIYLLEFYSGKYGEKGKDGTNDNQYATPKENAVTRYSDGFASNFRFSSTILSAYYKVTLSKNLNVNPALRISAGTNIYSAWNAYKKYLWFGIGLELGFSRKAVQREN